MELHIRRRLVLDVTLTNLHTRHYGVETRLFLEKKAGESVQHVAMKLLAWLVCYEPGLAIEVSVGEHYKPDVVRQTADGEITHWLDCGQTSLNKLDTLVARHPRTQLVIVKSTRRELRLYQRRAVDRNPRVSRVKFLAFEAPGITPLCRSLHKRHELVATVDDGPDEVFLSVDGGDVSTRLVRLGPAWEPSLTER